LVVAWGVFLTTAQRTLQFLGKLQVLATTWSGVVSVVGDFISDQRYEELGVGFAAAGRRSFSVVLEQVRESRRAAGSESKRRGDKCRFRYLALRIKERLSIIM
jgi:hypothetical protein